MRNRLSDEQGFTLIELLVVILIIGILAAIALPNFLGQRARGQDASAKSNARNAVSMVEACYTDNQSYTGCTAFTAASLGLNTGLDPATIAITAPTTETYEIKATSVSKNTFTIAKDANGKISRTCVVLGSDKGACNGTTW